MNNNEDNRHEPDQNGSDCNTCYSQDNPECNTNDSGIPGKKLFIGKNAVYFISLLVILVISMFLLLIINISAVADFFDKVNDILAPIFVGCVIAFLCNPILKFYEFVVFKKLLKKHPKLCRSFSLTLTVITMFLILFLIAMLIIPELIHSISEFIGKSDEYIDAFIGFINKLLNNFNGILGHKEDEFHEYFSFSSIQDSLTEIFNDSENVLEAISDKLSGFGSVQNLLNSGYGIITSIFVGLKNFFIGTFIGFYILASKEKRYAQIMKCRRALFSDKTNGKIAKVCTLVHKSFGGYIQGSIIDSCLVGVETWILFTIFGISDYNLLIATFIGITNIIPVFGPFIGAIPTGFIVLISNPVKLLLFIILILVIQQIDGNIIYPKILGNNTGISSLAVLIAITVMGSLFGVLGMVLGVPCFAVIITLIQSFCEDKLRNKGMSIELADYYSKNPVVSSEEESKKTYNLFIRCVFKIIDFNKRIFTRRKKKNGKGKPGASEENNDNSAEVTEDSADTADKNTVNR